MKMISYITLLFNVFTLPTYAQLWQPVGKPGFSSNAAQGISIALDRHGVPYVAFADYTYYENAGAKATVMKYNGSDWVTVGKAGFSSGRADHPFIVIDSSGTPYVAYSDFNNGYKATVMKYDGSSWITVGDAGFSPKTATCISLALDHYGAPYVVFDNGLFDSIAVMKYNGSKWILVGNLLGSGGTLTSITIDNNDVPYVEYLNSTYGSTVMKYNDSNWATLGFLKGYPGIVIGSDNTAYATYLDSAVGGLLKYDGNNWLLTCTDTVDNDIYSTYFNRANTSIAKGNKGEIFEMVYDSWETAAVIKYSDSLCVIGARDTFSLGEAQFVCTAADNNGTVYVAYEDGNTPYNGITVKQYNYFTRHSPIMPPSASLAIYPNPVTATLSIANNTPITNVSIFNVLGQNVYSTQCNATKVSIDVSALRADVYFVRVNNTEIRRFVKR